MSKVKSLSKFVWDYWYLLWMVVFFIIALIGCFVGLSDSCITICFIAMCIDAILYKLERIERKLTTKE